MCDCVHPVITTIVDLICPSAEDSWSHGKNHIKKNDDWAYARQPLAVAQVVSPATAQPALPQPAAPAGLNYRKHFSQYIALQRSYTLEQSPRPHHADKRSAFQLPEGLHAELDAHSSANPNSLASEPLEPLHSHGSANILDIESGLPTHGAPRQHEARPDMPVLGYPLPPFPQLQHHASLANIMPQPSQHPPPLLPRPEPAATCQPPPPPAQPQFWGQPLVTAQLHNHQPSALIHMASGLVEGTARSSGGAAAGLDPKQHLEINYFELRLGQVIGQGGFGKVYYGEWRGLPVAVKVMDNGGSAKASVVQEFSREVHTMSLLPPHPNVLRLLAASTRPPNLALVTEYCSQGSLYSLLHSPTAYLSWPQIVSICLAAARGMGHLHAHHVLHRDLKSGNLLVTSGLDIKVADFGLSRVHQDLQASITGGLGTYQWMAPEVLANQRYSRKADVYSFGVVAWECCARQVPYAGLNGMQAALAVMNKGLRPDIPRHTPGPLAALIRRCWAAVPEQRPTFPEIAEELVAMQQDIRCVQ